MGNEVQTFYGHKTRIRVCGICRLDDTLLMINHQGITHSDFWAPPGGGLAFAERAEDRLRSEFEEEAGIHVEVEEFLFVCELIRPPLHAIELFFRVRPITTNLKTGTDPEPGSPSIIKEARFMSWAEILSLPSDQIHGIFQHSGHPSNVDRLKGFFKL